MKLNRENFISQFTGTKENWDFIVIGGGATGLGIAVDAANRGYKTVLLEQSDFAKATSSRSTKLVHGGVRYLQNGDVALVVEALRERGYLKKNAPHLVKDQRFIIGNYKWWEKPFYTIGLTLYDLLAGKMSLGRSLPMKKKEVIRNIPRIVQKNLKGGVIYHDGQFDDSRLAINLMQTAVENGAKVVNHCKVSGLIKNGDGKVAGVVAEDLLENISFDLKGKCIINATGIFVDKIIQMDNPDEKPMVRPSQGVHLVVDKSFLGGDDAIMIPKTSDGRVMFGVPWHDRVILGTTDIPVKEFVLEPKALEEEVDFILETVSRYLEKAPQRKDILCVFAGLRPLAAPRNHSDSTKTKEISRSHKLIVSGSGLVTITGGKWTTYRLMAEESVDTGIKTGKIPFRKCQTRDLKIHGYLLNPDRTKWKYIYGSDQAEIIKLEKENASFGQKLHKDYEFTAGEVVWAVRKEMARTVDDVLARRVRALYLDARASIEMATKVAAIIAEELNRDKIWEKQQVQEYTELAKAYIVN
ncbi:MAG: glycerol-3-phosphate dehydrogenase/oxidase [Bacteroidales bacterium]|jgi:glycerol-3-phosphate dehydrogenase|nr:glycerol-3-phosphate dehydrogenase/oxidase [Bacteroidales bacterium]